MPVCPTSAGVPITAGDFSVRSAVLTTNRKSSAVAPTIGMIADHATRRSISGASNSIIEPSAMAMMPPMASTPWLTILISAISSTMPKAISSRPA